MNRHVQAHISNISFPKNLDELRYFIEVEGEFNIERIFESAAIGHDDGWTVPLWSMSGDIVFFFHAKTAIQWIRKLETALRNSDYSNSDRSILSEWLTRARSLYDKFGGKIFAVGVISDNPDYDDWVKYENIELHYKGRVYAPIDHIEILENPIPIEDFNEQILISRQSGITPVFGKDFEFLKSLILEKNPEIRNLKGVHAAPIPLMNINENNWFELNQAYGRAYRHEIAFRKFYVDYLLRNIGDMNTIYRECACIKESKYIGYVDNCILIDSKYCFVEVKLNWDKEADFIGQLKKYCRPDSFILRKDKVGDINKLIKDKIIAVDRNRIGIFDSSSNKLQEIAHLDNIRTNDDLLSLRKRIIDSL